MAMFNDQMVLPLWGLDPAGSLWFHQPTPRHGGAAVHPRSNPQRCKWLGKEGQGGKVGVVSRGCQNDMNRLVLGQSLVYTK